MMTSAATSTIRRETEWSWRDELERLEPKLASLPPAAQRAVRDVVASFTREDAQPGHALTVLSPT